MNVLDSIISKNLGTAYAESKGLIKTPKSKNNIKSFYESNNKVSLEYKNYTLKNTINNVMDYSRGRVASSEGFVDAVKNGLSRVWEMIKKIFKAIGKFFANIWRSIMKLFGNVNKAANDAETNVVSAAKKAGVDPARVRAALNGEPVNAMSTEAVAEALVEADPVMNNVLNVTNYINNLTNEINKGTIGNGYLRQITGEIDKESGYVGKGDTIIKSLVSAVKLQQEELTKREDELNERASSLQERESTYSKKEKELAAKNKALTNMGKQVKAQKLTIAQKDKEIEGLKSEVKAKTFGLNQYKKLVHNTQEKLKKSKFITLQKDIEIAIKATDNQKLLEKIPPEQKGDVVEILNKSAKVLNSANKFIRGFTKYAGTAVKQGIKSIKQNEKKVINDIKNGDYNT